MKIDGTLLQQMFASATSAVANEFAYIDQLNVFPVPDGDTGTNMKLTVAGALPAIVDLSTVEVVAKQFSRGVLMNARGNSGVIFSQVVRGFSTAWAGKETVSDPVDVVIAFENAQQASYKAVMAPVEGTMLTVIRLTAEALRKSLSSFKDVGEVFAMATAEAKRAVDLTPTMLKQLADAGVVDSGGYALHRFIEGMSLALEGKPVELASGTSGAGEARTVPVLNAGSEPEMGYGYCSEFIIKLPKESAKNFGEKEFDQTIARYGTSTVTVRDDDIVKIHTHTLTPGKLMTAIQKYGEFHKIKVENMSLQAENHVVFTQNLRGIAPEKPAPVKNGAPAKKKAEEKHDAAPEAVKEKAKPRFKANGASLLVTVPTKEIGDKLVREFGVSAYIDESVHGNPSTGDFLKVIEPLKHRRVVIITDNGNIVLAAEAAAKEAKETGRSVSVVPGKTIVQAMAAALVFNPILSSIRNLIAMRRATHNVETALISTSVKNIRYGKLYVKKDDFIGIHGKSVKAAAATPLPVLKKMADYILQRSSDPRSFQIIIGKHHDPRDLHALIRYVTGKYKVAVETIKGNQDVYPFILGV